MNTSRIKAFFLKYMLRIYQTPVNSYVQHNSKQKLYGFLPPISQVEIISELKTYVNHNSYL